MFQNEKGVSLVQVMMGFGMIGVLSLVVMNLAGMGMDAQKMVRQANDLNEIMQNVSISLKERDLCAKNFATQLANKKTNQLFTNLEPTANPFLTVGTKKDGMMLDSIATEYTGAGNGELRLTFSRGNKEGERRITKTLQMKMLIESKGTPELADFDPHVDTVSECYTFGGGGEGLSQEEVEQLIEAATQKYSWCGPTAGNCPATMEDLGAFNSIITGAPEITCKAHFNASDDISSSNNKRRAIEDCADNYKDKPVVLRCDITLTSGDISVSNNYRRSSEHCNNIASKNVDLVTGKEAGSFKLCCI